jgi:hypothetical protein
LVEKIGAQRARLDARFGEPLKRGIEIPLMGDRCHAGARAWCGAESLLMKRLASVIAAMAFALALSGTAEAGILSGVLPGLLSPSDTPATCDTTVSQPFRQWGDTNNYVLVPGGSFEQGTKGWTLGRGAKVVSGNEPFYVNAKTDRYSLYVPAGVTVTTPPMCFAAGDWHVRLFSTGSGTIRVKIIVKSLLGLLTVLDGGSVSNNGTWRPSPQVGLLLTNLGGILATDSISLRLTAGSTTRIDDLYLDPWKVG